MEFETEEDRLDWEEEQKRLDREWYNIDEGIDENSDPFGGTSEEYVKKERAAARTATEEKNVRTAATDSQGKLKL